MEQPDILHSIIKIASALAILIGILWAISAIAKKTMSTAGLKSTGKQIKVIENCYIGVKKTITLVKVPGSYLVLGIAGERITLLSQINESESEKFVQESDGMSQEKKSLTKYMKLFSEK